VGLVLEEISVDGCITKAPGGGECAGPSPVDRRKQGMKRSLMVEGYGIPLGRVRRSSVTALGSNRSRHGRPVSGSRLIGVSMPPGSNPISATACSMRRAPEPAAYRCG
jgi:hypothetical protein